MDQMVHSWQTRLKLAMVDIGDSAGAGAELQYAELLEARESLEQPRSENEQVVRTYAYDTKYKRFEPH